MDQGWELAEVSGGDPGGNWSTVSREEERWPFCPFCKHDLLQAEPIPEISAEAVQSLRNK
jgi:hypothetical protein